MGQAGDIKGMKLYRHPERIYAELAAHGYTAAMPLKAGELAAFDQLHYCGTAAVDAALHTLAIGRGSRILDIGSGLGGPARYLAEKTGCHVTALELQPDLHDIAQRLTARCGLADRVQHVCGDILDYSACAGRFDAAVSWLAFLHIPDRAALLRNCYQLLKQGGRLFVEDFCALGAMDEQERGLLSKDVYCACLPTAAEYLAQLAAHGFAGIACTDMTASWTTFVRERRENYVANRARHIERHGNEIVEDLEEFYTTMSRLFAGGNLGGLRIVAHTGAARR